MGSKGGWNTRLTQVTSGDNEYDSLSPPLVQTSTFTFPTAESGGARFAGEQTGYVYTRLGNPTVDLFEKAIADLEGAEDGLAFASGMGAISGTLLHLLRTGDHVLCSEGVYGSTYGFLQWMQEHAQIAHSFSPLDSEQEICDAIGPTTKVIYVETPINPTLDLVDIELVSRVAHAHGLTVVVDNTFMTPYLQRPITHGADIVIHSATKYLGGHGDVIAGVAVGSQASMQAMRISTRKDIGAVLSPFDAWLLLRGMKTLALRMDRHVQGARAVAAWLADQPVVLRVRFPEFGDERQQEIRKRQMRGPGALISFEVKGGFEAGCRFMNRLRLIKIAVSLGDVQSLIQHPASMTHCLVPPEERIRMGITDGLIRLSVGIEDSEDLIADLQQALAGE